MNILLILITAFLLIVFSTMVVGYFKNKTLEEIRKDVYVLFLKAEHEFTNSKAGKQKLEWVVNKARSMLPSWLQVIITEEAFERIIQIWFDGIKDLLDDGKVR